MLFRIPPLPDDRLRLTPREELFAEMEIIRHRTDTVLAVNESAANWSRPLIRGIQLEDGRTLVTLQDAAAWVLELPPAPTSRLAAEKILEAACEGGDLVATELAIRSAISESSGKGKQTKSLQSLYQKLSND